MVRSTTTIIRMFCLSAGVVVLLLAAAAGTTTNVVVQGPGARATGSYIKRARRWSNSHVVKSKNKNAI